MDSGRLSDKHKHDRRRTVNFVSTPGQAIPMEMLNRQLGDQVRVAVPGERCSELVRSDLLYNKERCNPLREPRSWDSYP